MKRRSWLIILAVVALVAASLACEGGSDDPDELHTALVEHLSSFVVREVQVSGDDLLINTRLDRADLDTLYGQIGTIHGVVVAHDPDVRRVVLYDSTGQRIIMPMDSMRKYSEKSITFDEFRNTWTVINPDEQAAPTKTPGRPTQAVVGWLCDWDGHGEITLWDSPGLTDRSATAVVPVETRSCIRAWSLEHRIVDGNTFYYVSYHGEGEEGGWVDVNYFYPAHVGKPDWSE